MHASTHSHTHACPGTQTRVCIPTHELECFYQEGGKRLKKLCDHLSHKYNRTSLTLVTMAKTSLQTPAGIPESPPAIPRNSGQAPSFASSERSVFLFYPGPLLRTPD